MKFTIKIGTRNTFFYCDEVSLSRSTKPEITLDTELLNEATINGIVRGILTKAITSDVDAQVLKDTVKSVPEVVAPVEAAPVIEEATVPAKDLEVTEDVPLEVAPEEVLEISKPVVKRRTTTK